MSRHPTDHALATWLETGRPARVGRHVEGCDACLARAEADSLLGADLRADLDAAVAPEGDVRTRTTEAVRGRLDDEEALSVLVDLFGLPWGVALEVLDRSPLGGVDPGEDVDRSPATDG